MNVRFGGWGVRLLLRHAGMRDATVGSEPMLLQRIVETSSQVADRSGRLAKKERLADLLRSAAAPEIETVIAFLSGTLRQTKIGVGYGLLQRVSSEAAASASSLTLVDVASTLERLMGASGKGSAKLRESTLRELFQRATHEEQQFLFRLLIGEVRQGALEGVMIDAAGVRRATMLAGDLGVVARAALTEGATGLDRFAIQLFRPIQPMLAQTADDVPRAIT